MHPYAPLTDYTSAPEDYSALFGTYYTYIRRLVRHNGIDPQNCEDVTMTILTKFFEKDALADFDPNYTTTYNGQVRRAAFRTFVSGFVLIYLRHYREKQLLLKRRENLCLGVMDHDLENELPEIFPPYVENHDDLYFCDLAESIRDHLATLPPNVGIDRCNLPEFFEALLEQFISSESIRVEELAAQFKVSKTTIRNWVARLRVEVATVIQS